MTLTQCVVPNAGTLSRNESYLSELRAAWVEHLKPKEPNAPTVISLFAGGGGSSLGYSMAGYNELLAVEWDLHAVETLKANFKDLNVKHEDITKITVKEMLEVCALEVGELDVLDGSPPCQGFSTAGKRDFGDERNLLFKHYVRALEGLKPKAFVMENVSGLVKGKMKLLFAEMLGELKSAGYKVKAKLINAAHYRVPQSRERVIFVGFRNDLMIEPSHPKPFDYFVSASQACRGVVVDDTPLFNDSYAKLWPKVPLGGNAADVIGKGFSSCVKLHPNRPACTLMKTQTGRGFATMAHWAEPRAISIAEAKRLSSFPDGYTLTGPYSERWARIGNSVPPFLMAAIARHVKGLLKTGLTS